MNGQQIVITLALDWRVIGALAFALFMFGLAFNGFVHLLGERKEGYTSFLVVAGVLITLLSIVFVSWQVALIATLAFVPSGVPMIIGDIGRHIWKRDQAIARRMDENNGKA